MNLFLQQRHAKTETLHSLAQVTRLLSSFLKNINLASCCIMRKCADCGSTANILREGSVRVASGRHSPANARSDVPGFADSIGSISSAGERIVRMTFARDCTGKEDTFHSKELLQKSYRKTPRGQRMQAFECSLCALFQAATRRCAHENWTTR